MEQLFNYISKRIDLNEDVKKFTESVSTIKRIKKEIFLLTKMNL